MLLTRKKVNWKNSRLCLLNMRVLLHAEFLHLVSRIQNFKTSLMKKGGCVVTLGIQFLNFFLKLDLKDNPLSHFLLLLPD